MRDTVHRERAEWQLGAHLEDEYPASTLSSSEGRSQEARHAGAHALANQHMEVLGQRAHASEQHTCVVLLR